MVLVEAAIALLPVLAFLAMLRLVDTYKLVAPRLALTALAAGALAAAAAYAVNRGATTMVDPVVLSRYVAPLAEESLKGIFVFWLLKRDRVGFLVDAAILGFAVGAGFACAENLYYLNTRDLDMGTWLVRGLGTAVMHGGATTVLAIISKVLADRGESVSLRLMLPGLAAAFVIHSAFNHFLLPPMISTAVIVATIPLLVGLVFTRSEAITRAWITDGFDADQEVLRLMESGDLSGSRIGRYLEELKERFPGEKLVDMLCLLRLEAELSVRAKGVLMMREAGFEPSIDDALRAKIAETRYLETSIGPVGRSALSPFLRIRGRERWQRQVLGLD